MLAPFDPVQHMEAAQRWAVAQGIAPLVPEILPRVGVVEPGVAVGWLYQTDSRVGLLEEFITNPKASSKSRHAAVDEIGLALLARAKELGLVRVIIHTSHRSIARMCIRRGFTYRGPAHLLSVEV
jgi:hypothetical protein